MTQSAEREATYDLAMGDVRPAIDWVERSFDDPGRGRVPPCREVAVRSRVYLYLATEREEWTDRLIFTYRKHKISGKLSSKRWVPTAAGAQKFHLGEHKSADLGYWAAWLSQHPEVGSSLLKVQRRYRFEDHLGSGCRIALDAMVPFPPDEPEHPGAPFAHLEVEARGQFSLDDARAVVMPLGALLGGLRATVASKKALASDAGAGPRALALPTEAALASYLAAAVERGSERLGRVLADLAVPTRLRIVAAHHEDW